MLDLPDVIDYTFQMLQRSASVNNFYQEAKPLLLLSLVVFDAC